MIPNLSERCYPELNQKRVVEDHLAVYNFAKELVKGKVLDIACGEGYGADLLNQGNVTEVVGVDSDKEVVIEAKEKYPKVKFIVADAVSTGFEDRSFDSIVSIQTWHHLDRYGDFVGEMHRVLRPGGLFIVSFPNKKVIYINPFRRRSLTEFYRVDFDKRKAEEYLRKYFSEIKWYGQRFVEKIYLNFLTKTMFFVGSILSNKIRKKAHSIFALADGPAVKPLVFDNARYLIAVCRKNDHEK